MPRRADLHVHSDHSDGTSSPAEVVRRARKRGLHAVVLTDHGTVSGGEEGRAEARRLGIRFACGVELNTSEGDHIHILGYGFDPASAALQKKLAGFRERRRARVQLILEKLRGLGVDIGPGDLQGMDQHAVGRPHVADALRRKKVVRSRREAFKRYLHDGGPAYVKSQGPTAQEAVDIIKAAGGWAVLAHPGLLSANGVIERLAACGLEGLEVYYPAHTGPKTRRLLETAERLGLAATGGSDYHGPGSDHDDIGSVDYPEEHFARIEHRLGLS